MTVSVAIDLALDRLFTYEVPEALREKLAVGQLLSVPFGHREARGFAIALDGDCEGEDERRNGTASSVSRLASSPTSIAKPRASRGPNGTERSWPTASFFRSASGTS